MVRPGPSLACCRNSASFDAGVCLAQDYLAPEMLMERPYTTSVDLWAAGVVTYEFLSGYSPFRRRVKTHTYLDLDLDILYVCTPLP